MTEALLKFAVNWWLDPQGLKRSTSIQLSHSQITNMRNGDLNGRGSAIWSWLDQHRFNKHIHVHHHNHHSVVRGTFEDVMNGFRQNVRKALEKIAGMLLLLTQTFLSRCFVIHAREGHTFLGQDRQWQVIWVQAGGGGGGWGGQGGVRQIPALSAYTGGGFGSNVSGDTQVLRHYQRSVYFEACQRLYRGNVHKAS